MPSHVIHISIANKVNKILKLDNNKILLGSVLPDLSIGSHKVSHFQNGLDGIEGCADPDIFIKQYKSILNKPIAIGYLIHLLTDKFYNSYIFTNSFIYQDNIRIGIILKDKTKKYLDKCKVTQYKHNEVENYDLYLRKNNENYIFTDFNIVKDLPDIKETTFDEEKIVDYMKKYNNISTKYSKSLNKLTLHPRFKLYNIKELNKLYNDCYEYILNYINDNLESKK